MNKIKVYWIHPAINDINRLLFSLCIEDQELADRMVWDPVNPDYVFVSENIYRSRKQFLEFKKYAKRKDRVFIGTMGESLVADMNMFDYAFSYDKGVVAGDRIKRISPQYIFRDILPFQENELSREEAEKLLHGKEGFCNFIYSNARAHDKRDEIFFMLSKYKKVDSLGRHLNNMRPDKSERGGDNWAMTSVQWKSRYKFSIAAENSVQEGYNSEKIYTSFLAHTVPIYFGDPNIVEEYNPKAFINVNEYGSLNELVEAVKKVDEDDDLWLDMVCQPWQLTRQIEIARNNMIEFQAWISHIFSQPIKEAKRMVVGTHHDIYEEWFFGNPPRENRIERYLKKIYREINYRKF